MNILVTGGAGFIGSHTLIELYHAGHSAVVIDNLSNSNPVALRRAAELIGVPEIPFYKVDIRNREDLEMVFTEHTFDACIHFAGLKAVGESVAKPWEYYENNIGGTLTLLYGDPAEIPITENCPKGTCTNPYGWTKSMLEQVLMDIQKADPEWNVVLLRYFNPVGAHPSGRIGENPNGIPNNLMPYITQVAVGKRPELGVFGDDYDTPDGTGVRDYIHVCDLAAAHVAALQRFTSPSTPPPSTLNLKPSTLNHTTPSIYNIGTGHGYSVLDMVKAFVRVNGVEVPYRIQPRRAGDIATCYCDPAKAKAELGWEAKYGIDEMVRDSWNWQRQNPEGYGDA